jgi:hypothetical protein
MASGGTPEGKWGVFFTPQAQAWYLSLDQVAAHRIAASFDQLELTGPATGRPFVERIKGSRHHKMKEARSIGGYQRALFAFDSRRQAIVLLGGDKQGKWKGWYASNIPRADKLFDEHRRGLGKEMMAWRTLAQRAGERSAEGGR